MSKIRWRRHLLTRDGQPPMGAIPVGSLPQFEYLVLQQAVLRDTGYVWEDVSVAHAEAISKQGESMVDAARKVV